MHDAGGGRGDRRNQTKGSGHETSFTRNANEMGFLALRTEDSMEVRVTHPDLKSSAKRNRKWKCQPLKTDLSLVSCLGGRGWLLVWGYYGLEVTRMPIRVASWAGSF